MGGTKTEMQRLIKDSANLTDVQEKLGITVDANDMSFANIVNAISVMQNSMDISGYSAEALESKLKNMALSQEELTKVAESMGITYDEAMQKMGEGTLTIKDANVLLGTTAREASTTIQGSANAMKGAWSNLLTGIADENADFNKLIENFIKSVGTFGDNIIPRIEQTLDGIVNLVLQLGEKMLPEIINMGVNLISSLITGITSNIGSLMTGVNQVISTIVSTIVTLLPQIIQARNSNNRVIDTRNSTATANFDTTDGRRRAFNSGNLDRQHRHAD